MAFGSKAAAVACVSMIALGSLAFGPAAAQAPLNSEAVGESDAGWSLQRHRELVASLREFLKIPATWRAPRTAWGHPSLEGVYSVDDMRGIPRDRPESFGTRDTLDETEFFERASMQQG